MISIAGADPMIPGNWIAHGPVFASDPLSARDADSGTAAVSVDGGPETTVDYYGSPPVGQQPTYLSLVLSRAEHN